MIKDILSVKNFFLFLLISISIYFTFLFFNTFLAITPPQPPPLVKAETLKIEPITISPVVKADESEETLVKLKLAVDDAVSNENLNEEKEAKDVLAVLKETVLPILPPVSIPNTPVIEEKQKKLKSTIEVVQRPKKVAHPIHKNIEKKIVEKPKHHKPSRERVKIAKVHKHKSHKKTLKKKIIKKTKVARVRRSIRDKVVNKRKVTLKKPKKLQEDEVYSLSKEESENFKNFEIVSISKTFTLEESPSFQNPTVYREVESQVALEELPLVETFGVVNVSKPSIYRDE